MTKNNQEPKRRMLNERIKEALSYSSNKSILLAKRSILEETLDDPVVRNALRKFTRTWGNPLRSSLLALSCSASGGKQLGISEMSSGLFLLGGGMDVHDDIIDDSKYKGKRATLFGLFGQNTALLVGDYLIVKGLTTFFETASRYLQKAKFPHACEVLASSLIELMDAEALDCRFKQDLNVKPVEYLDMIVKQAAEIEAYTRLGALLAGADSHTELMLGSYGRALGVLMALRDDVQDLIDFGFEAIHRLESESYPLPILYALQSHLVNQKIRAILTASSISKIECQKVFDLVIEGGGLEQLEKTMKKFLKDGLQSISSIKRRKQDLQDVLLATVPEFDLLDT